MSDVKVLHFHDAAGVGRKIVAEARSRNLDFRHLGFPDWAAWRPDLLGLPVHKVRKRLLREMIRMEARGADVIHVHSGNQGENVWRANRPYLLHLHGSDIRSRQYDPNYKRSIREAVRRADKVVYATPELIEHVTPLRDDAVYLPVPVSRAELPELVPVSRRRGVFFASRWEAVKGGALQIEVARAISDRAPEIEMSGLNWGEGAKAAAAAGVRLRPRMSHPEYLQVIAHAGVVVGQGTSILATSELEALALGIPLIGTFDTELYPELPRLSETSAVAIADGAIAAALDPEGAIAAQRGRDFALANHETSVVLDQLLPMYQALAQVRS